MSTNQKHREQAAIIQLNRDFLKGEVFFPEDLFPDDPLTKYSVWDAQVVTDSDWNWVEVKERDPRQQNGGLWKWIEREGWLVDAAQIAALAEASRNASNGRGLLVCVWRNAAYAYKVAERGKAMDFASIQQNGKPLLKVPFKPFLFTFRFGLGFCDKAA